MLFRSDASPEPSNEPTAEPTAEPTLEPSPTPETRDGQVISKLTGTWVKEKYGNKRPYAVVINNLNYAYSNHSGISQASIIYEALVEGGITRNLALFEEFDAEKIGSVRSARHYFVSIADEYDAIFVHYGHTKYATAKMKELETDNLSGLEGVGSTVYFRDNNLKNPHNAFASYEGIKSGTKIKKYRTKYEDDYEAHRSEERRVGKEC